MNKSEDDTKESPLDKKQPLPQAPTPPVIAGTEKTGELLLGNEAKNNAAQIVITNVGPIENDSRKPITSVGPKKDDTRKQLND